MFGHAALFAGRRLAACAYGEGIGVKLPAERVAALIAGGRATPFQPYGRARMRAWAYLAARSARDVAGLRSVIAEALDHVARARD